MGKKATQLEIEERVNEVFTLLVHRASHAQIVQHAAERWGVQSRQAETYTARARELLRQQLSDTDREMHFAEAIASRRDLYQRFLAAKDYWGALKTAQDLDDLLGLYFTRSDQQS